MPIVRASNWSMTLLLSISPASRSIVGNVVVFPPVMVTEPCALRNPLAVATTLYIPGGAVKANVPSTLAGTDAASVSSTLYKLIVTGLEACTCPVSVPAGKGVGVAEATDVAVNTGVGDSTGVAVNSGVGDSTGVET